MSTIEEQVIAQITEFTSSSKPNKNIIEADTSMSSLGMDSLDMLELVMALEHKFDVNINDEDSAKFITVNDVIVYITNKKDNKKKFY